MQAMADMNVLLGDCLELNGAVLTACMWKTNSTFPVNVFVSRNKPHMNFPQGCVTHFRHALENKWGLSHSIAHSISMLEYESHG